MPKAITLRTATDKDKAWARNVHHQAYRAVITRQFGVWDEMEQDAYFDRTWSQYRSEIILWYEQPSGYWSVESTQNTIHLHQFLILPEFQGRGIGTALLHMLIHQSYQSNASIQLQVFRESEARKLYMRVGFAGIDESDDHVIMQFTPGSVPK